jgi:ERCC4-type nuclease
MFVYPKGTDHCAQVLIVDTAEPAEVRSELAKVNATMASAKLISGDFAWLAVPVEASTSDYVARGMMLNTGVERKRVTDLVASIKDQRLRTQMCGRPLCSAAGAMAALVRSDAHDYAGM